MFFKVCFLFFFINLNGVSHPVEKFLFKKENDNVCELKGGVQ